MTTRPVPADLTELPNWVLWRYVEREGKRTKVPFSTTGSAASSTNPSDWSTFDDVREAYEKNRTRYAGIGLVFDGGGMCGIDLDDCLNPDQTVKEWAQPIIGRFSQTYMEVSPSGKGIKIWCRGKLPGGGVTEEYADGRIEIYDRSRYFAVTGNAFHDAPLQVEEQQSDINWLLGLVGRDKPPVPLSIPATSFNMTAFIDRYVKPLGWDIRGPYVNHHPTVGGFKWRIEDGCPFQRDYACGSPSLGVTSKGAASFKCFCGSHPQKNWHDLKALVGAGVVPAPAPNKRDKLEITSSQAINPSQRHEDHEDDEEVALNYTPWPQPLSELAFHGPLGDLCRLIEPNTEADIAAVLFQALVMAGNVFGRGVHFMAEGTPHYCNEFVGIVGATAKGRKGSSFSQVRRVIEGADRDWSKFRIKSGLTSGEGLIFHIRDETRERKTQKGQIVEVVTDPGENDKRMLVVEEELSSAIKAMSREGNTLSGVLRQAWDSPIVLAPMTKNNRITASFPHVSIIGHITRDELIKSLKAVENTNGGTNRFLWCCARRSKLLPFGGSAAGEEMARVVAKIDCAVGWAQMMKEEMLFDAEATEMWSVVYEELGDVPSGTIGAILSRSEPHVRRVAMIYAALDQSRYVNADHLTAALEIWRYSQASARWIFASVDGVGEKDKTQEQVLLFIKGSPGGCSRRDIAQHLSGRLKKHELEFHLSALLGDGKIRRSTEKRNRQECEYYYIA